MTDMVTKSSAAGILQVLVRVTLTSPPLASTVCSSSALSLIAYLTRNDPVTVPEKCGRYSASVSSPLYCASH